MAVVATKSAASHPASASGKSDAVHEAKIHLAAAHRLAVMLSLIHISEPTRPY